MFGVNRAAHAHFLLFCGLCIASPAWADATETAVLRSKPALLRMSYEVLDLTPTETMGLAGVHYLVNVHPDWYIGASGFGALAGERGGFFTGGFTVGTGKRFASKWLLDAACLSAAAVVARPRKAVA